MVLIPKKRRSHTKTTTASRKQTSHAAIKSKSSKSLLLQVQKEAAMHVEQYRINEYNNLRKLNRCQRHMHNTYQLSCSCRTQNNYNSSECRFNENGDIQNRPFASNTEYNRFVVRLNNMFDRYLHTKMGKKCACNSNNSKRPYACKFNAKGELIVA